MNKLRLLALSLLIPVAACGGNDATEPEVTVASVSVSPSTATLSAPGETVQLTATVRGSDGSTMSSASVNWSSSDATVATVSGSGLVTGVAGGTVSVTASAGGQSGSATVTVVFSSFL